MNQFSCWLTYQLQQQTCSELCTENTPFCEFHTNDSPNLPETHRQSGGQPASKRREECVEIVCGECKLLFFSPLCLNLCALVSFLFTPLCTEHRDAENERSKKGGQQSDMKWKESRRGESLRAYLGNVQGQWSTEECCSHRRLPLNLSLPPQALGQK